MKICVADDEKEVRESIIYKLKALFPLDEIYDVQFGREALEQIQIVHPDLVFLDIRMPEMDGLEILNCIKQTNLTTQVVILSGYGDFEYAQKALQLGAFDYLLKPADRERLRDIVEKMKLDLKILLKKELEVYFEKLSNQYLFIHDLCFYNASLWFDERQWKEIYFGDPDVLLKSWEDASQQILMSFSINADFGGIVVCPVTEQNARGFHEKHQLLSVLIVGIEQWESRRFFVRDHEFSNAALRNKNLKDSLKQAVRLRQEILSFAKARNIQRLETSLYAWLACLLDLNYSEIKKECMNLMATLDEGLIGNNDVIVLEDEKLQYWSQWVATHKTWIDLSKKIQKFVLEGVRALMRNEHQSNLNWFEQALHLVETSRDPKISLEIVAEIVGVHSVTLSRIFKQQTGMNFVKYLVRCRLQRAQSLLLKTNKKINEISEQIGYIDYRYFRNLFKREFGLTPSEYRIANGYVTAHDEAE